MHIRTEGHDYDVELSEGGLVLRVDRSPPRVLPWSAVAATPAAWAVVASGFLQSRHATPEAAHDKAADLAAVGLSAAVIAIPHGLDN